MRRWSLFLLFLAALAWSQVRSAPTGEWYRSNALGALVEPIIWFRSREWEWAVQRKPREGGDTLILYRDGKAVETRIRDTDQAGAVRRVRAVRDGATRDVYDLDPNGRLTREEFWREGRKTGELRYIWNMDQLSGREFRGANGRLVWTDEVQRTPSGRIRRVVRRLASGGSEWHAWSWGEGGLGSEGGREGQETFFSSYNPGGLVRRRELGVGGVRVQVSEYSYVEGTLSRRVDKLVPEKVRETRRFDAEGRVVLLEFRKEERLTAQERRRFEGDLLVQVDRIEGLNREQRNLSYNEEGQLIREEISRNGELEAVLIYEDEKLTLETIYLGGRKVVEIRWQDDEKVEEIYFDIQGNPRPRDPRRPR